MWRELFLNLCKHPGMVTPSSEGTLLLAVVISSCYQLESCEEDGNPAILTAWCKPVTTFGPAGHGRVTTILE